MSDISDLNFDANKPDPGQNNPIPKGEYDAVIVASERKTSQAGGWYLKLELQILGGEFQNRRVFDNLNLFNTGPKKVETERIANSKLHAIARAVGVLTPKDGAELHGKPLKISVNVKDNPDFGLQNVVTKYKPRLGGGGATAAFSEPSPAAVPKNTLASVESPWG